MTAPDNTLYETRAAKASGSSAGRVIPARVRLARALTLLLAGLAVSAALSLWMGYRFLDLERLSRDETARTVFFSLRLPRVVMAAIIGASLASVGASLQALFRNPLADPFTLGVSGGGALGASVAIGLGWGAQVAGVPLIFVTAFAGAGAAGAIVYRLARTGTVVMPGALLLAGVVLNLIAAAGVMVIQYIADYTRAIQILRWTIGSIEVIGFDLIYRMLFFLVPGWIVLLAAARNLHLLAMGEETAASLGVNVRRCERAVYLASSLLVGVSAAVGGTIGFVGLIVPHAVRLLFGEDVRILVPCSFLAGAGFLMLADALARTLLGASELPVGVVTALLGGPVFLLLLRKQKRYSVM